MSAFRRLMREYKDLVTSGPDGIMAGPPDESEFLTWTAMIEGPPGSPYDGGVFEAILQFPVSYPMMPPTMKFTSSIWHPNVYPDGRVCISTLHAPGEDPLHYESSAERWSAVQSVEKILLSVMSMLAEPNDESAANLPAAQMWRQDRTKFFSITRRNVLDSLKV